MSTKLTHHIFLRLAGPNKGSECCLGGAGHVVVPLFGVGGTPRGISFLPPKLMKINFKARKKKKALWAPSSPTKGATKCPLPPKQHSGPLFGPASLRKMWRVSFVLMHASSGELWHSSGELRRALARSSKFRAKLRGAGFWVTMCFYGHVKSRYTFWGHLGPFPQLRQISPELATSSGNRKPRQVNRITAQVLVTCTCNIYSYQHTLVDPPGSLPSVNRKDRKKRSEF